MTNDYFNAVAEVARLAGNVAKEYYGRELLVDVKHDGSPVTVADRTAEEKAREWIQSRFPDDGIVGEEFDDVLPNARRRWIIDPIDGTKSFVRTVPLWGTLIAVAEGDDVLAGCAYFPVLDDLIVAATGMGCHLNGTKCSVSNVATIEEATVLVTDSRFQGRHERRDGWTRMADRAAIARTWGDCYGYLLLASGRAEVMLDDIAAPWDSAALFPIVTEAGGVFTSWTGERTAFGGDIIATNAMLATEARALLACGR